MLNHSPSQVTSKSVNLGATLDGPLIKGKFEAAMDTGTPVEAPLHDLLSAPAFMSSSAGIESNDTRVMPTDVVHDSSTGAQRILDARRGGRTQVRGPASTRAGVRRRQGARARGRGRAGARHLGASSRVEMILVSASATRVD